MEFSRPEYWSGLPFPSPGDLPNSGIEPASPILQADSLSPEPPEKPDTYIHICIYLSDGIWIQVWFAYELSIIITKYLLSSLVAQLVNNLPAIREAWV